MFYHTNWVLVYKDFSALIENVLRDAYTYKYIKLILSCPSETQF